MWKEKTMDLYNNKEAFVLLDEQKKEKFRKTPVCLLTYMQADRARVSWFPINSLILCDKDSEFYHVEDRVLESRPSLILRLRAPFHWAEIPKTVSFVARVDDKIKFQMDTAVLELKLPLCFFNQSWASVPDNYSIMRRLNE
jgi:hypothetical protein